ncbi:MAG: response regulator transcription factor [Burkholderiales bacterium]|nr:MAG: response regulator transcription factor [Burkholderiales bacterium]
MPKIAIIEDDRPTNNQFAQWATKAVPDAQVDQLFARQEAEEAIRSNEYDLITLDIELGAERNAGVSLIKEATRTRPVPVLVVSGMPADLYRGVMKALDAWDYLQKPVGEHDFNQTLLSMLSFAEKQKVVSVDPLHIDPLTLAKPTWKGQRLNLTATQQRLLHAIYERRNELDPAVSYDELFQFLMSGKNTDNLKRQISQIRSAFEDVEGGKWSGIIAEPLRGYRWVNR